MTVTDEPGDFSPAQAIRLPPSGGRRPRRRRLLAGVATAGAGVLGAAPHVVHHAGPLAGAALVGGASGSLLFGVLGFVAMIPFLVRLRRRTGSWRMPGALLALFAVVFSISTFVVGPALSGDSGRNDASTPAGTGGSEHERHHPDGR